MALLYMDGFEGYASPADMTFLGNSNICRTTQIGSFYTTISSSVYRTTQPTAANSRSLALTASGGGWAYANIAIPARTEIVMGMGIRFFAGTSLNGIIAIGGPSPRSSVTGIVIAANMATGLLYAYTNANGNPNTLLGTLSGTYSQDLWYFMEIRIKVGTTTGELQIKIDGTDVLNLTNINTATGSLSSYTGISFFTGGTPSYSSFYIDDLYIADTTGPVNNTFLGSISVYSLMPNGSGSSTQLAPVGAASNWQTVADVNPDTTTYVETSVTGQKDFYNFQDLPAGVSTINGVLIKARSTTPDNGGRKVKLNLKNGVSVLSSALRNLSLGSWFDDYMLTETAADGSAWTKTLVDGSEAGVEAAE